jgi:acetolactate synthase I/II/III large subunit
VTGAHAVLDALQRSGVEDVFCSPGSEWPPVWEELARRRALGDAAPRYWNARHEILAVSMASGYVKATRRLPAVMLHTTVGVLSAALALRAARHEHLPLLVLAGESIGFGEDGFEPGPQWLRYLADRGGPARLAEPFVKWSFALNTPALLSSTLQRAAHIAMTPPRGPVLVSLPFEYVAGETPAPPLACAFAEAPVAPSGALDAVAEVLAASRNPLIVTEQAGEDSEAASALVALAEALGAGVVESLGQTYVSFPRRHPLHGGFEARPYLADADVVLLAGVIAPWHPASAGPPAGARVIALGDDVHRSEAPSWGYRADLLAVGALGASLGGLVERLRARGLPGSERVQARRERWARMNEARRQAARAAGPADSEAKPITARWLVHTLAQTLPPDAVVVEETITHRRAIMEGLDGLGHGACYSAQSGGLGVGLGLALGMKCAMPSRPVVALVGDGSFNYNPVLAALGFCQEYGLPIGMVLFDNGGYASMKRGVPALYPDGWAVRTGVYLGASITPGPSYAALAGAFGGHGEAVDDPRALAGALRQAFAATASGRLALVDVVMAEEARRT